MSAAATAEATVERAEAIALAGRLARRELAPRALELDRRRPAAVQAAWEQVAGVGFHRALLAPEHGGVGLDAGSLLCCVEEIAVGDAGLALLVLLANGALAALPPSLAEGIGEDQRWAIVPAPPSQLATPARIAVRFGADGDRPVLTGSLSPALGALGADGIVVVAEKKEPLLLAIATGTPGLEIEECEHQLGLRAAAAARISLSDVVAERVSPGSEAEPAARASLALLRAGSGAIARGIARRAHEVALEYAENRVQGGVPIIEHDAVRRILSSIAIDLAATPSHGDDGLDPAAATIAKVAATEAAVAASANAVQVFGGTGYMRETGVEKLMRDAKYLQLWPEPNWVADDAIVAAARCP